MHKRLPLWAGSVACLATMTASTGVVIADIQSIGPLAGDTSSGFVSFSIDGRALVARSRSSSGASTTFLWTPDQGTRLPPAGLSALGAVSAQGHFVTGQFNSVAARWDTTTGTILQLPPELLTPGRISGDGRTITGQGSGVFAAKVTRWREGGTVSTFQGDISGDLGRLGPISSDGSVAAAAITHNTGETSTSSGFYWDDAGVRRNLGGSALPTAMTPDGTYLFGIDVHYSGASHSNLARWRQDGTYDILISYFNDKSFGEPVGVDGAGTTLAMNRTVGISLVPSLWRADTGYERVYDHLAVAGVNLTGWTITRVSGMSPDGLIFAGEGVNPSGQSVVWYATIPSPSAAGALGFAYLMAPRRRRVRFT